MELTPGRIRELFDYDADTGALTWLERSIRSHCVLADKGWNTRFAGKPAGRFGKHGHFYVGVAMSPYKTKNFAAHRVAWAHHYGEWPDQDIDHINGIAHDNRIANLRLVTDVENLRNQKRRSDNTSGHKGVSWVAQKNRWYAYINVDGKMMSLGYHADKADAVKAREDAAERFFGEHARKDAP